MKYNDINMKSDKSMVIKKEMKKTFNNLINTDFFFGNPYFYMTSNRTVLMTSREQSRLQLKGKRGRLRSLAVFLSATQLHHCTQLP